MTHTHQIYTLSLHDALPISLVSFDDKQTAEVRWLPDSRGLVTLYYPRGANYLSAQVGFLSYPRGRFRPITRDTNNYESRSEEHTSELQSRQYLVCRLLLEKK